MAGDVKVAVVSGAISTSGTGTADFTKAGFGTPKACIVLLSFDPTDDGSVAAEGKASIGFSDFTNHKCITHQDEDASAKADCDSRKSATKAYVTLTIGGAVDIDGTASTITDGVRLTNTTNGSATAVFATVIMFGGADLQVSLDSVSVPSSAEGTQLVTTGIDQDLVFFIGSDISGEDSSSTGINNSFGVAHIDTADHATFVNRCIGWASDHNNAVGSPSAVVRTNRCLKMLTEAGGDDWGVELSAATTTSYTIRTKDVGAGAGMECYALALDLDDRKSKVSGVSSPTSGTSWTPSVALGFTPQYVGIGVTHLSTENIIVTDADAGGHGISSNTGAGEEAFHGWYNEDASAVMDTANNFRSRVLDLRNDDTTVIVQDHSHSSFNDGNWTYTINTENETTAKKWFYWAIEEAAEVVTTGTGVQTLPSLNQAGAGVQEFIGTGVQTLPSVSQDGVGVMQPSGSGVQALPTIIQVGAGVEKFLGTGAQTLAFLLQSGVGVEKFLGTGVQILAVVAQAGVGLMQPSGTGAQALVSILQAGVGAEKFLGTGAQTLAALIQSGVGLMHPDGVGVQTLAVVAQSASGAEAFVGAGAQTLVVLTQAGVGLMQPSGAGDMALPLLLQVGAGTHTVTVTATGVQVLSSLLQAGVGLMHPLGVGLQVLPPIVQSGAGEEKFIGAGAQILSAMLQSGAGLMQPDGTGEQALPSLFQAGAGDEGFTATSAQTLFILLQSGVGNAGAGGPAGVGVQILPAITQLAAGVYLGIVIGGVARVFAVPSGFGTFKVSGGRVRFDAAAF